MYPPRLPPTTASGMYKEAYETSKEYAVLLDTLRMQELRKKMENLEIEKGANELVIEKKSLELELQESKKENYLYMSLLLLALCAVFYIFFRLGKMRSLYQALQKSNEQVLIANRKAQESEEMKTAFIRNMSHEIRTPIKRNQRFLGTHHQRRYLHGRETGFQPYYL